MMPSTTTLGDLVSTQKGFAFKSAWFGKEGVPVIKVTNFTSNSVDMSRVARISEELAKKHERYQLHENDVVVQTVGSWPSNPESVVGKCIRIPSEADGALLNQNAVLLKPNEQIDRSYLYYLLKDSHFFGYIVNTAQGAASQAAITLDSIKSFKFSLPDINDQLSISAVLDKYDQLIRNNEKRIQVLEDMSRLLYGYYFDREEQKNWSLISLEECLTVHRGKSYKSSELGGENSVPFVNLKCINRGGGFRKSGIKLFNGKYKPTQVVKKGDIVVAVTDMTQERLIVARPARVPSLNGGYGVISMDVVKIEPKAGFASDYLYAFLRWSNFADEVRNHANGANVLHLLPARISEYKAHIAPSEVQEEFAQQVHPLFELIDNLQLKNEILIEARDLLLPRLMSGEIRV